MIKLIFKLLRLKNVYLIERCFIDSMEKDPFIWEPYKIMFSFKEANEFVLKGGFFTEKDCYAVYKENRYLKYRIFKIEL